MKLSEMNATEQSVFDMANKRLGIETVDTEDTKRAIDELREFAKMELNNKTKLLNEIEKVVTKLEKREYI